ncbi:MAG: tRNA lysidine(34) synthetase TilS, partial [Oscillospiraceae bacterium]|nr:tRNA lysidine(34) synthetase TilS [Oscillospiraceae bacterium]
MSVNIKNNIIKFNLSGKTIIAAVSGGADSVCLLLALNELKPALNITLEACHVNHMLRGEQSNSDEAFVHALCERLGIRLHIRKIDVKTLQQKHKSLEETAREARYSFFFELGTNVLVATAHTAD